VLHTRIPTHAFAHTHKKEKSFGLQETCTSLRRATRLPRCCYAPHSNRDVCIFSRTKKKTHKNVWPARNMNINEACHTFATVLLCSRLSLRCLRFHHARKPRTHKNVWPARNMNINEACHAFAAVLLCLRLSLQRLRFHHAGKKRIHAKTVGLEET